MADLFQPGDKVLIKGSLSVFIYQAMKCINGTDLAWCKGLADGVDYYCLLSNVQPLKYTTVTVSGTFAGGGGWAPNGPTAIPQGSAGGLGWDTSPFQKGEKPKPAVIAESAAPNKEIDWAAHKQFMRGL